MKIIGIASAILLAMACVAAVALTASGRLWWKSSKYQLVVNNGAGSGTAVYSGRDVLLVSTGGASGGLYVVYPQRHELGAAVRRRFVHLPGCVLSLDNPATYIPIGKYEVPVRSQFGERQVEFLGVRGEKITMRW